MSVSKCVLLVFVLVQVAGMAAGQPASGSTALSAAGVVERLVNEQGIEAAVAKFDEIKGDTAGYVFDEAEFNNLGYGLIRKGKIEESIAVMEMMTELFPDSWNAWDSKAEAYKYAGDKTKSKQAYEKSLSLNPDNENATWSLRKLDGRIEDMKLETREAPGYEPGENTGLKGPYLGQTPPGTTPVVFAPGIVSARGNFEFAPTFSADNKTLYFSSHAGLRMCRLEEEGWTAPEYAPFTQEHQGAFEAHITPDGAKMFFGKGPEIWVMDRTPDGWSEAKKHGLGMYATTTSDGTLYVTDILSQEFGAIVSQHLVNGEYTEPVVVTGGVSAPEGAAHPCISPDESFIVFDSWRDGAMGQSDLYMCYRRADGSWSDAVHLPAGINTVGENICASLSRDGRYMFFTTNNDIYWVSTEVLRGLMPKED